MCCLYFFLFLSCGWIELNFFKRCPSYFCHYCSLNALGGPKGTKILSLPKKVYKSCIDVYLVNFHLLSSFGDWRGNYPCFTKEEFHSYIGIYYHYVVINGHKVQILKVTTWVKIYYSSSVTLRWCSTPLHKSSKHVLWISCARCT